ncbi:MAG: zf-HC2 domain-containing protein [Magnetococcus sp. DMHC-8]
MNILSMKQSTRQSSADQLAVLLTLAAEQGEAGACPPPPSLTALLEGRLPAAERTALLAHLDRCAACYRVWLGTAALLPVQSAQVVPWRRAYYRPVLSALALAAGLVLVLVRWDPWAPDLPGMLTTAYQTARLHALPSTAGQTMPLVMPGKEGGLALGFAGSGGPSPVSRAFAAGAGTGWEMVQGRSTTASPAVEPEWMLYHHLGRWTLLLQTLCQAVPPPPVNLFRQQAPLGIALEALLAKRAAAGEVEARIPRQELEAINQLLDLPPSGEPAHRLCRQIQKSCTTMAEGLLL